MDDYQNSNVNTDLWIQADESVRDESLQADSSDEKNELGQTILCFLKLYWKRRRLASAIIGTGAVLSVAYALLLTNVYTSTATLMPPDNSSPYSSMLSMLTGSSSAASLGGEALGIATPGDLLLSILQSRTVQEAMVARFDLMHYYKSPRYIEDACKMLNSVTKIDQDRKSGVISISVTDVSAQFASKLTQGYITELNRVMTDNSTSAARRQRIFLESRLKDVKHDLDESSKALSQFSTKNKALDIPNQAKSMVDAELRLEAELADGRSQLAALRQTYSEDNYRVKAVMARNAELEREINSLSGLSKKDGTAASSSSNAYPSMGELPTLGLTYFDLDRRVHVDEELWETLTKQYEMARVQEAKEIPTIQVLDAPNVSNRKSGPRRTLIVLFCTFLSFAFSCCLIYGLDFWKNLDEQSEAKRLFAQALAKVKAKRNQPMVSKASIE